MLALILALLVAAPPAAPAAPQHAAHAHAAAGSRGATNNSVARVDLRLRGCPADQFMAACGSARTASNGDCLVCMAQHSFGAAGCTDQQIDAFCSAASPPFPESRLISAAHGAQLNEWANKSAGQKWELCYTSFTMDKSSAAEFHSSCDQYTPTFSVAHNSGGKPGKCEGRCDDQDNDWQPCTPVGSDCSSATRGQGVCVGHCSSALGAVGTGGCSANGTASGTPCPGPPKLNSTFGGFVRPCI